MATLPASVVQSPTVTAIYAHWANTLPQPRAYLGGSVLGRECERALWYGFRWANGGGDTFDGRMLRLFDRGQREEQVFVEELRAIGCTVPEESRQTRFKACAGHAGGGIDGAALGVPDAPRTWHLLEMKTHNARSYAELSKKGVKDAKPEHWAQMQIYMRWAQLDRALYLAVNKDTDELYAERVKVDTEAGAALEEKADRIIFAAEPPPRLSDDPSFFKCKFCPAAQTCHTARLPAPSCRTCLHATPERDGDGRWSCALADAGVSIPLDVQRSGCESHLYIPALLKRWGEVEDASEAEGWVSYKAADGHEFRNGPWGIGSYTSKELHGWMPGLLREPEFQALRVRYAAQGTAETFEEAVAV